MGVMDVELTTLSCDHYGAPVDVSDETDYLTCLHCHTSLAVRRTSNSAFTEEFEWLANRTSELADRLEAVETQLSDANRFKRRTRFLHRSVVDRGDDWMQRAVRRRRHREYEEEQGRAIFLAVLFLAVLFAYVVFKLS